MKKFASLVKFEPSVETKKLPLAPLMEISVCAQKVTLALWVAGLSAAREIGGDMMELVP